MRKGEQVVIFEDPANGKFVQFAVESESREVIVDISLEQMTETIYQWLSPHMEQTVDSKGKLSNQIISSTLLSSQIGYSQRYTSYLRTMR